MQTSTPYHIEDESTTAIPEEEILRGYGYLDDNTDPMLVDFYREMIPKSGEFSSDWSRTTAVTTCARVIKSCHEINGASKIIDNAHSACSPDRLMGIPSNEQETILRLVSRIVSGFLGLSTDQETQLHLGLGQHSDPAFTESGEEEEPLSQQLGKLTTGSRTLGTLNPERIPTRDWLMYERLMPGYLSMLIAPGAAGKSMFTLMEAVAVATGQDLTGYEVRDKGNVLIINLEDDRAEIERRIYGICKDHRIDPDDIADRVRIITADDDPFVIAKDTRDGVEIQPDVDAVIDEVKRHDIKLVIVDPLKRSHRVTENSNDDMDEVADELIRIAREGKCAVSVVHHTGKVNNGRTMAGDPDAGRGASAVIWASRVAHTLTTISKSEADSYNIPENEMRFYVRLDQAKANLLPPTTSTTYFKRHGVCVDNGPDGIGGDYVGVLNRWEPPTAEGVGTDNRDRILEEIQQRFIDKQPLSASKNTTRWAGYMLKEKYGLSERQSKDLLKGWMGDGTLVSVEYDKRNKQYGLAVAAAEVCGSLDDAEARNVA